MDQNTNQISYMYYTGIHMYVLCSYTYTNVHVHVYTLKISFSKRSIVMANIYHIHLFTKQFKYDFKFHDFKFQQ